MESMEALKLISKLRPESAIVVTAMTCNAEWPVVTTNADLDLPVTGAMGKASSIGLGLALARPDLKVLVLDADGSLLMNLGTLVSLANMAPPNLVHFVFENGVYRTTGGQPIPGHGKFDIAELAKAAGYPEAVSFSDLSELEAKLPDIISGTGLKLVSIKVPAATERPPHPIARTAVAVPRFKAGMEKTMARVRAR